MVDPVASHDSVASQPEIDSNGVQAPTSIIEPSEPAPSTAQPSAGSMDGFSGLSPQQSTAPASAPMPAPTQINSQGATASIMPGFGSGEHRLQIRLTQPQHQGQVPRSLHIDRASGQVRLDLGRGNVVTIPLQHQIPQVSQVSVHRHGVSTGVAASTTPVPSMTSVPTIQQTFSIRSGHLPPLVPVPVAATATQQQSSSPTHEDDSLARFKCAVCYEFMKDPVGCPSETCSSRFCQQCFVRAARESNSQQQASASSTKPKCPTCRVEFTHYVQDLALNAEMMTGPTVACKHAGCLESQLKMPLLQDHESRCDFEQLKCRYATFGCPWIGRRGDLTAHEAQDCALHKVAVLVDKFRELELDHANRLNMVQQQTTGALHMLHVYRQNAQRDLLKSTTNLFDILQYVHVLSCATQHFLQTKERWHPLFRSNEGRGAITNFLVLLPTILSCGVTTLLGIRNLPRLLIALEGTEGSGSSQSIHVMLEDSVMGILIGIMTGLLLLTNFVDSGSSVNWGTFAFPGLGTPPVMCDLMTLCLFTMHVTLLDSPGPPLQSMMMWTMLCVTSTVYPAMILTMSHESAKGWTPNDSSSSSSATTVLTIVKQARSLEPVLFGLRFSLINIIFGILPTLDATALTMLISSFLQRHNPRLVSMIWGGFKHCFFEGLTGPVLGIYLSIRVATSIVQLDQWDRVELQQGTMAWNTVLSLADQSTIVWEWLESLSAFVVLMGISAWLNAGLAFGIQCGRMIVRGAEQELSMNRRPEGTGVVPSKDYQLMGLVSFGVWVCLLGMLVCLH